MKKIAMQRRGDKLLPFSEEDKQALLSFKENELLVASISGTRKKDQYCNYGFSLLHAGQW